jgi:hypothetical protein
VAGNQAAFTGGECGAVAAAPDDQRSYHHARVAVIIGGGGVVGFLGHIDAAGHLTVASPMNQRLALFRAKLHQDLLVSIWL